MKQPWKLNSLFWPSFFGGPLAVAVLMGLNASRLGVARAWRNAVVACGVVAMAGTWAWFVAVERGLVPSWTNRPSVFLAAIAAYLAARVVLSAAETRYRAGAKAAFASLWLPGIAAVVGCAVAAGLAKVWAYRLLFA